MWDHPRIIDVGVVDAGDQTGSGQGVAVAVGKAVIIAVGEDGRAVVIDGDDVARQQCGIKGFHTVQVRRRDRIHLEDVGLDLQGVHRKVRGTLRPGRRG